MTDPMLIAAASTVFLAALSSATVTIITAVGRVKKELLVRVEAQTALTTQVDAKADEIHSLVDGSASRAAESIATLQAQLVKLHGDMAALQNQRVEDAKTRAASDRSRSND